MVECVGGNLDSEQRFRTTYHKLFSDAGSTPKGHHLFRCDLFEFGGSCSSGGLQHFKIRYYPCHHLLSHPLECGLMHWL